MVQTGNVHIVECFGQRTHVPNPRGGAEQQQCLDPQKLGPAHGAVGATPAKGSQSIRTVAHDLARPSVADNHRVATAESTAVRVFGRGAREAAAGGVLFEISGDGLARETTACWDALWSQWSIA